MGDVLRFGDQEVFRVIHDSGVPLIRYRDYNEMLIRNVQFVGVLNTNNELMAGLAGNEFPPGFAADPEVHQRVIIINQLLAQAYERRLKLILII